jgi:hypothetical protein
VPQPTVVVHGKFVTGIQPSQGTVTFTDNNFSVDSGDPVVFTPNFFECFLDQNGEFWVNLPLNVGINSTPVPREYHVEVAVGGHAQQFDFVLGPTSMTVEFSSIIPVAPLPTLPQQFVASLAGMTGAISASQFLDVVPELIGQNGKDNYELWLANGNVGSYLDYLETITGPQGPTGPAGITGNQGPVGPQGNRGPAGPQGRPFHIDIQVDTATDLANTGVVVTTVDETVTMPRWAIAETMDTQHLWQFDGVEWVDLGAFRGPQGVAGATQTAASLGLAAFVPYTPATLPVSTPTQNALNTLAANVGQVQSVNGAIGTVVIAKGDIGLGNVDNTSDAAKPVSTAQGVVNAGFTASLGAKEPLLPTELTGTKFLRGDRTFQTLTPAMVGLSSVRNFPSMDIIAANVDLNTLTSTGTFHQPANANATLALNYPVAKAGFLQVLAQNTGTSMIVQYYTNYGYAGGELETYRRGQYSTNSWSPWRQLLDNSGTDAALVQSLKTANGGGVSASGKLFGASFVSDPAAGITVLDGDPLTAGAWVAPLAPSAATAWTAFPQGYSIWRVQSGVSGSPTDYPDLTGTLEVWRDSTYPKQRWTNGQAGESVRMHVGGAWTAWKRYFPTLRGSALVPSPGGTPGNSNFAAVVFSPVNTFTVNPIIQVTPITSNPAAVHASIATSPGLTPDGFSICVIREDTISTGTIVHWTAFAP